MEKSEVFGVIWTDRALGHLTLTKPDKESALVSAASIRTRGAEKVENVRAVRVPAGSDEIEYLEA
ncbi:hypothetical protein [Mesorhizobium sp.]|uniref:hypothetical protein n=1 Tax=Mesorhizobium sp. TaxID=1871066 RepID=UPI000FE4EE50|nr:hypothetical protein [Mesorhizobium sp.]RWP69525.1 MAG: hypothetical protein EOR07_03090 [Mesorhizobium sp.]